MGIPFWRGEEPNNLFHSFFLILKLWFFSFCCWGFQSLRVVRGISDGSFREKMAHTKKKEMHAFLGRVALMENDGNRDKHPCLSDRMEVEISDVFFIKKSHRQSSNILVSWNLNRKQNQPMPVALTMNDGCFTRAKINPEPELKAISAKIAKYCKVYATKIISTNTEPKKTSYIKPTKNNRLQGSIRIFFPHFLFKHAHPAHTSSHLAR